MRKIMSLLGAIVLLGSVSLGFSSQSNAHETPANPMAFIAEQSGGLASTGKQRVMEIQPLELHQRVPFFAGSKLMVEKAVAFVEAE